MDVEESDSAYVRVFISSPLDLALIAASLRRRLEARGVSVAAANDIKSGRPWKEALTRDIQSANLFLFLVSTDDPYNRAQQFEASQILEHAWSSGNVRVAVVAPAVQAIPTSLRNKPFVSYYPHDEVRLDQWMARPLLVDAFVDNLLDPAKRQRTTNQVQMRDQDIEAWRNRIVHLGRSAMGDLEGDERANLLQQLQSDLSLVQNAVSRAGHADEDLVRRLLNSTLLTQALGDEALARRYYELLQESIHGQAPGEPRSADAYYAAGLAALNVSSFASALEALSTAAVLYRDSYGEDDPRTIASLFNAATAARQSQAEELAVDLYSRALSAALDSLGRLHPQTAAIAFNLAQIVAANGQIDRAVELLHLAEDAYRRVEPEDSPAREAVEAELDRLRA